MRLEQIRKGARFVDLTTGDIVEIVILRKAKPAWFVIYLRHGVEKAMKYEEFTSRFELYDPKEHKTKLAS